MSDIDLSQFENKIEKELETALPSDLASKENAMNIAEALSQFAEEALAATKKNLLLDHTDQITNTINTFGTNPQGSSAPTNGSGQPGRQEGQEQTVSPEDNPSNNVSEGDNRTEEERPMPENQETEEDLEAIPSSASEDQEQIPEEPLTPAEPTSEEIAPESMEDSLGFTNPANHSATDEQEEDGTTNEQQTEKTSADEEQRRAQQLAMQQQAARSQNQQAQNQKKQEVTVLTTKRSALLKKAGAVGLKGSPIIRIILGVTDTLDVAEFEDGALLSSLTSPLVFTAQAFFYILQNSETKHLIREKYIKKGLLLAAMEVIPFISILPWDSINSWLLSRSVKKGKEGYNKEAADIATTIKKIESNQNH